MKTFLSSSTLPGSLYMAMAPALLLLYSLLTYGYKYLALLMPYLRMVVSPGL